MNRITFLILAVILISCNDMRKENETQIIREPENNNFSQNISNKENIEDFGEKIFKLIVSKNFDSILSFYPTYQEYEMTYQNSDWSSKKIDTLIKKFAENENENKSELKESYDYVISNFEKKNIDLTKANLNYIDFDYKKHNKVETSNIYLKFNINNENYKIELESCYLIDENWKIFGKINLRNYRNSITGE